MSIETLELIYDEALNTSGPNRINIQLEEEYYNDEIEEIIQPKKTRTKLRLDWSLNLASERINFINEYIKDFDESTLSEYDLETIANYLLWGKNPDGSSPQKNKDIDIETRHKTWTRPDTDSLDELMESPTFNEASLSAHPVPTKAKREVFSREEALRDAPSSLKETFKELFLQIDTLDLKICLYEILHQKRTKPPREQLLLQFRAEDIDAFNEEIKHWNQFLYLKKRHLLVELRSEQYTLRDTYAQPILRQTPPEPIEPELPIEFGSDIQVLPLGLNDGQKHSLLLFRPKDRLNPSSYAEDELEKVSAILWREPLKLSQMSFDFRELEDVYALFQELLEFGEEQELEQHLRDLINTLYYYVELAELSEVHQTILDLKVKKIKNQDIADFINRKYQKSYTANYISTIFRQKIIPRINEAAALHLRVIQNLFFEEEFKKCSCCGQWLLRDSELFVRKTRSKDGLANRCKRCDKLDRLSKKGG